MQLNSSTQSPQSKEGTTEWRSLTIANITTLCTSMQFTIYFATLWPYLSQLDPNATESFFGWITAAYSLTQAIMSVGFGYWQNRIQQCRIPLLAGLILMVSGSLIYLMCGVAYYWAKVLMLVARAVTGLGAGVISVTRTYAVNASTVKDRSRAISLNSAALTLGITLGPALQFLFTPLGHPGINLIGDLYLNIYTAPAFMSMTAHLICVFLVIFFFHESNVGLQGIVSVGNGENARFFALPKYDKVAVMICFFTRFVQFFMFASVETLGTPISMTMLGWSKQQTVLYNSLMHSGSSLVSIIIFTITTYYDIGTVIDHRISTCAGMLGLTAFFLLTYPWWFLPGSIPYQEEYELCKTTPPVNPVLFIVTFIFVTGTAFSLSTIGMNTVFSTLLGPRNQGTMQGILVLFGNLARVCGAILVAQLFTEFGLRPVWGIEVAVGGFCAFLWIYFYKRIIPLKRLQNLSAGDVVRNKYGLVYKF